MDDFSYGKKVISKTIFFILYLICVFVVSLFSLSAIMNRGNTDMTMEMGESTFPVVTFRYSGFDLTCLHGYSREMDVSSMRDNLTPVKTDRTLSFRINTYGKVIGSVRYELRSMDGSRLIENGDVTNYFTEGNSINASITLKDLMSEGKEYSLCIIIQTPEQEAIRYYTRLLCEGESDPYTMLTFAYNFSHKTFDKANAQKDIQIYLESNDQGDNSTFHKVDIHSSFYQVTWGDLQVERVTTPQASILDLDSETGSLRLDYMVKMLQEDQEVYFRIKEYFRLRKGEERMYLLDYERTMSQIFDHRSGTIANNKFVLGITDEDVEMVESPDSNRIAFVNEGRLYGYNVTDNKLAEIFSFYEEDMLDLRSTYWKNNIRIFQVDESGNVEFMVYGYMNRGEHEGDMGIAFYYYNSVLNTVEEQLYVPYDRSYEMLEHNLNIISYMTSASKCYLFLEGALYEFNLEENKYKILEDGLQEDCFVYSEDSRMIAWVDSEYDSKSIEMYNLQNFRKIIISAASDDCLQPIGFFGDDLVYGVAKKDEITTDSHGNTLFPMYEIVICDENNRILKEYQEEGVYIVNTEMKGGMVSLTRAKKGADGSYEETTPDQILNNISEEKGKNKIETVITENYEKIVQLAVKSDINLQQLQILTPRFVMHEGGSVAEIEPRDRTGDYYVYKQDELIEITRKPQEAVKLAYESGGIVMNEAGQLIYDKAVRRAKNQIMAISAATVEEGSSKNDEMAVCLNAMLLYNGIAKDTLGELKQGKMPEEILQEYLTDAEVLNLRGCALDAVLGYVDKDIPVLVEFADGGAFLLVGYNEYNTVVMDSARGEIYKIGINDSTELFEANGNRFVTYIK